MKSKTIAVMVSGRGSNLDVILKAIAAGMCPVDVQLVISNKAEAPALEVARQAGVPHVLYLEPNKYQDRARYDAACADLIDKHGCQWIVLAGYMRILSSFFVRRFPQRIINIHPALLPAFPGAHAVDDAVKYGVKVSGCSVHLVDEVLDGGPILAQAMVSVLDDDTPASLHARIQIEEHKIYPATLKRMIECGFTIVGRKVVWQS
ncbi:MAG: phosphoribosylglycinamide formyltransferase [Mariprofundus sp.]|nr:phosphoribosylglycinamide formyltransferase [Mariprofundus sp.]